MVENTWNIYSKPESLLYNTQVPYSLLFIKVIKERKCTIIQYCASRLDWNRAVKVWLHLSYAYLDQYAYAEQTTRNTAVSGIKVEKESSSHLVNWNFNLHF